MIKKPDSRGVSLALAIGLLLLLITITTTINELVIRTLRASHQIEASDKAYFAAEGGIEDALYELSAHAAGYETNTLGTADARNADLTETVPWINEWEIKNKSLNTCDNELATWEGGFSPTYCGRIYGNQKLVINMFTDDAQSLGITTNEINETMADINTLTVSDITIRFRLPVSTVTDNPGAFGSGLLIDNDGDLGVSSQSGPEAILGLNEDGHEAFGYAQNPCPYSGGIPIDDNDCDAVEDEDSPEDPVILWKIIDGSGNSFQPLRGCKGDPMHASHPANPNATLCEKNFVLSNNELAVNLTQTDMGVDQDGNIMPLEAFLSSYAGATQTLQMELLVVSPMEAINVATAAKIPIPHYEYGIEYNAGGDLLPSTFFSIRSDGYYRDFKQSITTNVVPRATTRLLDLTIIQQ